MLINSKIAAPAEVAAAPRRGALRRFLADRPAAVALAVLVLYLLTAFFGEIYGVVCRHTDRTPIYERGDMDNRFQPPGTSHWFGTDYQGRDVFWRAIHGVRTAVKIGLVASLLAALIGVTLGLLAGYFGGWIDDLVVWFYSVFAAMPTLLFVLAFSLLLTKGFLVPGAAAMFRTLATATNTEPGMLALYLGIGLTGWVSLCRVVRGEAMRLRETAYVQAARTLGFGPVRILLRHVLPNLFHLVIIYFTLRFAFAVMTEVIVSFLGLGVQLEPSWGVMIADGQQRLWRGIWWEVGGATLLLFGLVLALNMVGDALRDHLDPRLRA
jgi:peptide/nickel transport system permease protein